MFSRTKHTHTHTDTCRVCVCAIITCITLTFSRSLCDGETTCRFCVLFILKHLKCTLQLQNKRRTFFLLFFLCKINTHNIFPYIYMYIALFFLFFFCHIYLYIYEENQIIAHTNRISQQQTHNSNYGARFIRTSGTTCFFGVSFWFSCAQHCGLTRTQKTNETIYIYIYLYMYDAAGGALAIYFGWTLTMCIYRVIKWDTCVRACV